MVHNNNNNNIISQWLLVGLMPSINVNLSMKALMAIEEIRGSTGWKNFRSKWISAAIMEKACRDFPGLMGVEE